MKPERVFRIGSISASVFANEIDGDGGKRKVRNVNLQRRYRDGDEWKSTTSFALPSPINASRFVPRVAEIGTIPRVRAVDHPLDAGENRLQQEETEHEERRLEHG